MSQQSTNQVATFDGFMGFTRPEDWPLIAAYIDNLAEFKVVEWLQRNIWDEWVEITTEMFMHGYDDGINIDCGTGLSKPSVIQGIKRAVAHGLIEVDIDDTDLTHIRKFYRMRIAEVKPFYLTDEPEEYTDTQDLYPGDGEEVCAQTDEFYPVVEQEETFFTPSKELEPSTQSNNSGDISRIQEEVKSSDSGKSALSCGRLQMLSRDDNATLCNRVESFSSDLGDHKHTASNIGQTRRILARYLASGGDFETFLSLMYDARDAARRKTNMRRPNRMPYFFACLKRACKESKDRIAA